MSRKNKEAIAKDYFRAIGILFMLLGTGGGDLLTSTGGGVWLLRVFLLIMGVAIYSIAKL